MKTILVSACMLALISFGSCKKEGCTSINATNYDMEANSDDGSCKFQAQDYVGTYNVTGTMYDQIFGDSTIQNYQFLILHTGDINISISNLGNTGNVITATIKNNQLTIPKQDKNVVETWSGSGVISGNTINLNYSESFYDDTYFEVAVKQ